MMKSTSRDSRRIVASFFTYDLAASARQATSAPPPPATPPSPRLPTHDRDELLRDLAALRAGSAAVGDVDEEDESKNEDDKEQESRES